MAITRVTKPMTDFGESHDSVIQDLIATDGLDSTGFLRLGDTPTTYTGNAGLAVVVNPGETGLTFATLVGGGVASFLGLSDTPGSFGEPFQIVRINADGDGLEFVEPVPPGPDTFVGLADTPSTLVGEEGKFLHVSAEDGNLQFVALPPSGASTFLGLNDTPESYGPQGSVVAVTTDGTLGFVELELGTGGSGSSTFAGLSDTPESVIPGQYLRGDPSGNGRLQFVAPSWPSTFAQMTDTPAASVMSASPLQSLRVNAAGNRVEFFTPAVTPTTLAALTDTPSGYGVAGQLLVTDGVGALTWEDPAAGGVADFTDLGDVPSSYIGTTGQILVSNGAGLVFEDQASIPTALTELADFPVSYSGAAGKFLAVNGLGNGVEFVNAPAGTGGGSVTSLPAPVLLAITDETSVITVDTDAVTFRSPYAFTLGEVRASLTTASSSGVVQVNVRMNLTTIFSTQLTIDSGEKTSMTAEVAAVLTTTAVPDDAEFTIDIVSAGTNAVGLKVSLIPA